MSNPANLGTLTGHLTREPRVFVNQDGSKGIRLNLAVRRNFKNADGEHKSDFIDLRAWVSADAKGIGPYAHMTTGSLISVQFSVRQNVWVDKTGKTQYEQVLFVEEVHLLEGKKRLAQLRAAANAAGKSGMSASEYVESTGENNDEDGLPADMLPEDQAAA